MNVNGFSHTLILIYHQIIHCEGGLGSPQWVLSIHHNFEYDEELISLNLVQPPAFQNIAHVGTLESEKSKKWPVVGYVIDQDKH